MAAENWGSVEWNENHFPADQLDTEGDTWGIRWRGMEKMRHESYLRIIGPDLTQADPRNILDIGCALCDFTHKAWSLNKSNKIWGMDISRTAISWNSSKFPEFTFQVGAAPDIPFDVEFDLIFFLEIMCYLNPDERFQAIRNIQEKLRPGGKLLFSGVLDGGVQHHTRDEVTELIGKEFAIETVHFNHWSWHRKLIDIPLTAADYKLLRINHILQMTPDEFDKLHGSDSNAKLMVLRTLRALRPLSVWILKSVSWVAKKIVSSKLLAKLFHHVSRVVRGPSKADEIVILAKKSENT